ncbi:MAG TPA: ribosome maturation factor RimM [Thermoanaerobaculia bacterium]|nr:ribosome maturation factor RimM [Thermoanaerobaculia bacterium]HXK69113.1 ribosome maturation factor RimM [Thermoanaerobaculia bacterium]
MNKPYLVGRILKPHGIRGEVRAEIITDFPERFQHLQTIMLAPPEGGAFVVRGIKNVRFHKTFVLLTLSEVEDRDTAEALRGWELYVPEEERWETGDDFFYYHELLDLSVILPGGEYVGKVTGFEQGTQIILQITREDGSEVLVPFVADFVEVHRNEKIIVHPIPGLLSRQETADEN